MLVSLLTHIYASLGLNEINMWWHLAWQEHLNINSLYLWPVWQRAMAHMNKWSHQCHELAEYSLMDLPQTEQIRLNHYGIPQCIRIHTVNSLPASDPIRNIPQWPSTSRLGCFNPLYAIFFRGYINIWQRPTYSTYSISWLLMSWWCKEPRHQQQWYWPS